MKVLIDTNNKSIEIHGICTIGELTDFLSKFYPDFTWRELTITQYTYPNQSYPTYPNLGKPFNPQDIFIGGTTTGQPYTGNPIICASVESDNLPYPEVNYAPGVLLIDTETDIIKDMHTGNSNQLGEYHFPLEIPKEELPF